MFIFLVSLHKETFAQTFTEIFPYSQPESFSFFFLCGTFTTHSSQGRKIWVFPFSSGTFIFLVKLYNEVFAQAFYRGLS